MGYIGKNAPVEEILAAIRKVNDGGIYISEKLSERMAYQRRSGANAAQRRPVQASFDKGDRSAKAADERKEKQAGCRGIGNK